MPAIAATAAGLASDGDGGGANSQEGEADGDGDDAGDASSSDDDATAGGKAAASAPAPAAAAVAAAVVSSVEDRLVYRDVPKSKDIKCVRGAYAFGGDYQLKVGWFTPRPNIHNIRPTHTLPCSPLPTTTTTHHLPTRRFTS